MIAADDLVHSGIIATLASAETREASAVHAAIIVTARLWCLDRLYRLHLASRPAAYFEGLDVRVCKSSGRRLPGMADPARAHHAIYSCRQRDRRRVRGTGNQRRSKNENLNRADAGHRNRIN